MHQVVRRRRLAPADRRAQIVEEATSLIAETGYHRLTMSELAQRCGITRAGLSHHFGSREDVFVAVLRQRDDADLEQMAAELRGQLSSDRALDAQEFIDGLDVLVRRNAGQPEIVRLYTVLSAEALAEDHPAHDYFRQRARTAKAAISRFASRWHPDPDVLAAEVHAFLDGVQLDWMRDPELDLVSLWRNYSKRIVAEDAATGRDVASSLHLSSEY